jgi:hypothetical protein
LIMWGCFKRCFTCLGDFLQNRCHNIIHCVQGVGTYRQGVRNHPSTYLSKTAEQVWVNFGMFAINVSYRFLVVAFCSLNSCLKPNFISFYQNCILKE